MSDRIESLFDDVVDFYLLNMSGREELIDKEVVFKDISEKSYQLDDETILRISEVLCRDKAAHVLAVAWVLSSMGVSVQIIDNGERLCLSVKHVKYDLLNPTGVVELKYLYVKDKKSLWRIIHLEEAFDLYLKGDHEAADFINAFAIRHGQPPSPLEAR